MRLIQFSKRQVTQKGDSIANTWVSKKSVQSLEKEELKDIEFDLIVCVGGGYQSYGKFFKSEKTKVINSMPMMLQKNIEGVDSAFIDNWIIKAPPDEMQEIFKNHYVPYDKRENRLLVPASIGGWKNQKEILEFIDTSLFDEDFYIHFAGTVQDQRALEELKEMCKNKNISAKFGYYNWQELSHLYLDSKLVCLTSDPRPGQSCDPCPRVIFEALCAGTPCLVNNLVLIHEYARMFTRVYQVGNKDDFNEKLKSILSMDLNKLSDIFHKEYEKIFSMENGCSLFYAGIMKEYKRLINMG